MNKSTLTALKASIAHWRRMATGKHRKHEDIFHNNCPLCERFNILRCQIYETGEKCPIFERTGIKGCEGSPWDKTEQFWDDSKHKQSSRFLSAARKQLAFLESLLPKTKKRKAEK